MSVGEDVERAVAVRQDPRALPSERIALVDLLDRLLAGGVVIAGDVVISIAEIDLVRVSLRALITTVKEEYDDILPH
ncbi:MULTISPECIES: gas vesicle protein [Actinoallomurus]|uniref:gas vesicle protein n=1 Tax=Actinoallomurus TaxID=667113 RepID=UPI0020933BA7|nr:MULTISPECIES: gas vesicle protein [Actinoallomurus]MCO5967590.1 gas vesicle protein [Actinoallomurus soli]MCO5997183.1 gas vesicle protein [Actinoallomurus rhizosphaericola]